MTDAHTPEHPLAFASRVVTEWLETRPRCNVEASVQLETLLTQRVSERDSALRARVAELEETARRLAGRDTEERK